MWMQKSVEGSSFSSSAGNFHDRNRFGSPYASGGSYGGGSAAADGAGDWKSKILESGQWLGGKVIEYGGKLARGPNSDAIPEHYAQQMPRNDGRANWMADIRSSSSSYSGGGGYSGGFSEGYQNDFATERPKAYSDYSSNAGAPKAYEPKSVSADHGHHHAKGRHAKKKSEKSKKSKKSRKSKKKQQSESESEEEEELSISESSETESADERRVKSKGKAKKKHKTKKNAGFYSESESSDDDSRKKASADYEYSFDPAKLPPPPAEEEKESKKKSKSKKSKKEKSSKKSRARRQSVASTDDESTSEKESTRKAKKRSSAKAAAAASASVDLLGVDLDVQPMAQPVTTGLPAQEVQPSIFDTPQSQNPLQDLAGLSFAPAPVQAAAPTQQSIFDGSAHAAPSNETTSQPQQQADAFRTNLLPENNIVDFSSLASEKKKSLSANPEEKRTLNDLQKARGADQPTPVMAMPMQAQPQMQNMSGNMMQLSMNMNQLQLTDGMQQQMYPMQQMSMQGMSQPQMQQQQMMMMQPPMGMMAQPQMMNMQMMQQQQQQFAQGGAAMAQPTGVQTSQGMLSGASNSKSSDPFRQLP